MEEPVQPQRNRNLTRRILAGVVIGVTALAIAWIFTPREPAIVAGLSGDWDARNAELVRRVGAQFPVGSAETTMRKALLDQGFTVSDGQAKWDRTEYPCRTFVTIRWQAQGGRITSTGATTFQGCM
ncbi:hypothetical protein P1X14_15280 [Sphingomonas sp. AOB5]|uniref:hypothetical protein n=1 Tax=Sphingomonas sp. AOB5 TaxID=3034017 RepID=UPI0023F8959E|nr:hypothetical protein [Sphingomonas sp. AOB5]MDF7776618.1 hypothetical protein [Sphingomonas sp. AOB5]